MHLEKLDNFSPAIASPRHSVHRSRSFMFTSPRGGRRARVGLSTYSATSLVAAPGKALEARGHIEAGKITWIVLAAQGAAEMTVTALVDAELADPERLRKNVVPLIGAVRVTELRRRDARTVTDARLRRDRKVEATRVFEDLHAMVRWVVQNEYLEVSTLDGMTKLAGARTGDRVLTDDEIRVLWQRLPAALSPKPGSSKLAIF